MSVIDYLLIAIAAAAAIYTIYRLFIGWRNSNVRHDEERTDAERLNASNFES